MTTQDAPTLKKLFKPQTLTQLGVIGTSLVVSIEYEETTFAKTGGQALLHKLPIAKNLTPFKSSTQSMDVDLSCVTLDRAGNVLETIWYGKLRNENQSIRHAGDALCGAVATKHSPLIQEDIRIRLQELDDTIHHLIFFISSYHKHALNHAKKGMTKITDNEGNVAHKFHFDSIDKGVTCLIAWHIKRHENDFLIGTPLKEVTMTTKHSKSFVKDLADLASAYLLS